MEKEIGKLNKNDTTDIVVRIDDFGGKRGLTIREFVTSDRYTGFTKSGVRIIASDFPKFKEMINSISEEEMAEPVEGGAGAGEEKADSEKQLPPNQETLTEEVKVEKPGEDLPDY